ncbi:hypothetical protein KY290_034307 [Solanum tuberosum]|uniref:Uncharacterized protein n=1 Tax=Solanum tuberosum TaxID=4113 RepID=A0ABQ7U2V3_SOLTU|nr:hypothetical protein KY284_033401 [Solanum tuberosum]KAH0741264.1 hypothetical protein KY290_034307 [Solanum tuberosum]
MVNSHPPSEDDSSGVPIPPLANRINNDDDNVSAAHKDGVMLDDLEINIDFSIDDVFPHHDADLNVSLESSKHEFPMESVNDYKVPLPESQGSGNCHE